MKRRTYSRWIAALLFGAQFGAVAMAQEVTLRLPSVHAEGHHVEIHLVGDVVLDDDNKLRVGAIDVKVPSVLRGLPVRMSQPALQSLHALFRETLISCNTTWSIEAATFRFGPRIDGIAVQRIFGDKALTIVGVPLNFGTEEEPQRTFIMGLRFETENESVVRVVAETSAGLMPLERLGTRVYGKDRKADDQWFVYQNPPASVLAALASPRLEAPDCGSIISDAAKRIYEGPPGSLFPL